MTERHYWIGVVSKDHVDNAIAGHFTQVNHGKAAPLERMKQGDGFAFYSPRESYPDGAALQASPPSGGCVRARSTRSMQAPIFGRSVSMSITSRRRPHPSSR